MPEIQNPPLIDEALEHVRRYAIGFLEVRLKDKEPEALNCGSGTLVRIGRIAGIMTAGHVVRALPTRGLIGLVRYANKQAPAERLVVEAHNLARLPIGGADKSRDGPDLGFLRLAPPDVSRIEAGFPSAFRNLLRHRETMLGDEWRRGPYYDGIAGLPKEWEVELPSEGQFSKVMGFEGLMGYGAITEEREANGFDLLEFEVDSGEGSESPTTYGGVSGGLVWRVYLDGSEDTQFSLRAVHIIGIPFFETITGERKMSITCHGPRSIYGHLIDRIQEEWSSES